MKKIALLSLTILAFMSVAFGQAKKPIIMVVPSDSWCLRNGFVQEFDNMGTPISVPDYSAAFLKDPDIRAMITSLSGFMASEGYPLQSLEQELKRIQNESAEMAMMMGKQSGGGIVETPIERLRRTAKADIILNLDYTINKLGPNQHVEFNFQAIDAYSSKIISGITGVGDKISTTSSILSCLQAAVLDLKDGFLDNLNSYFYDMSVQGREISVTLFRYDSCPIDFEEEYEINGFYAELADIIEAWFADHAVSGRFLLDSKSANRMRFNQVRIPLTTVNPINGRETPVDANGFVRDLVNMLKKSPYNLVVGRTPKGLGEVWITLGDK